MAVIFINRKSKHKGPSDGTLARPYRNFECLGNTYTPIEGAVLSFEIGHPSLMQRLRRFFVGR